MKVEVTGSEEYACEAYKTLFETIMNDVGKAILIDSAKLVLRPDIPMFIFCVKLVNEPVNVTVADAASLRQEGRDTHLTISEEKYAPDILSQMWKNYGRDHVEQQTRFDMIIYGGDEEKIANIQLSSGSETKKEIIGALWRVMPEGIKVRHNISDGTVVTIVATEEIMKADAIEEAVKIHKSMGGRI